MKTATLSLVHAQKGRFAGAPRALAPVRSISAPPGESLAPERDETRVNILIVDDEPKNLVVLESVLDDPGYRLCRAESGEEALMALMGEEFAVLVLDIRMPGMTGFELAQMIKERKKTARIPIIFLTAYYNEDQHVLTGYDSGAVDYLHKPVNAQVLRSKVAVFAELYRKGRALELANNALLEEVTERRRAETQLRELNDSLDRRVIERTRELHESNTDLRHMQSQLRDADRRKDEFLATLAHELRNPLAPVRNAVHIMKIKDKESSPELQWARDVIERQVRAMARLIEDLMDVSRISQDKIELRREPVELAAVLHDAVETSRPVIDEHGHELAIRLPVEPLFIHADSIRLAQVFMNLLNNAAKYMDRGGRVELAAAVRDGQVRVTIRDQGIGIAAERLSGLFTMFSQVEAALSRSRGGLGVGLALARRLVELHEGRIEAHSEGLGRGSEFVVTLPLLEDHRDASPQAAGPDSNAAVAAMRVLVVDDNEDAALALAALLEMLGYKVRTAFGGEAAVRAAAEFHPHLALLDIGMPGMNGLEACRAIRALPHGGTITLVAVTGWGQEEDLQMSEAAGFDHHLVKPVDPQALTGLIAALAEKVSDPSAN